MNKKLIIYIVIGLIILTLIIAIILSNKQNTNSNELEKSQNNWANLLGEGVILDERRAMRDARREYNHIKQREIFVVQRFMPMFLQVPFQPIFITCWK